MASSASSTAPYAEGAHQVNEPLVLVSHVLCPYVQRAAIVLAEKGIPFERRDIDLANKPDWFLKISPLGKTPVLLVGGESIFESSVICEYLEETGLPRLHPDAAPLGDGVWISAAEPDRGVLQRRRRACTFCSGSGHPGSPRADRCGTGRRPLLCRQTLQHRRRRLRAGLPLFRCLRCDRRIRLLGRFAKGAAMAPCAGNEAFCDRGGPS